MIVALLLLGYALLLATLGPPLLIGAKWVDRAPRLAIMTWQVLSVTVLAAIAMAGLALLFPTTHASRQLAGILRACAMALREQYSVPGGFFIGAAGGAIALAVIGRATWCLGAGMVETIRERSRHQRILNMVGQRDEGRGIVILDCQEPSVYCLPGRRSQTVVTTAALDALDRDHLDAVLAHERAHLTERHDLAVAFASALATAFSALKVLRHGAMEIARLVELRADDIAAKEAGRLTVAEALLTVGSDAGTYAVPAMALTSNNNGAARVRRLIPPSRPLGRVQAFVGSFALAGLLAIPVLVLAGPAVAATSQDFCPITSISASR